MIVPCHGCFGSIDISVEPKKVTYEYPGLVTQDYLVTPCIDAPHICSSCRADPLRLAEARLDMDLHFLECKTLSDRAFLIEQY